MCKFFYTPFLSTPALLLLVLAVPAWQLAAQDRPATDTTARGEAPYKQGRLALFLDGFEGYIIRSISSH